MSLTACESARSRADAFQLCARARARACTRAFARAIARAADAAPLSAPRSFYAGPDPYNPADLCHSAWYPWPWNPIGAGDVAGNSGTILEVANTSSYIVVRSRPLQWACKNVTCECEFSTNVSLAPGASAVTVHAGLQNARSDKTD